MESLQQIGAILLVLGLLASALYFLKKKKLTTSSSGGRLQILERISLGPQHAVCLVRIDRQTVVITTSPATCEVSPLKLDEC